MEIKSLKQEQLLERIRQRLDVLGLSMRKASILAVGNETLIRNIGRGRTNMPKPPALYALAKVLQCDPAWLAGEEEEAPVPTKSIAKKKIKRQNRKLIRNDLTVKGVSSDTTARYNSVWVAEVEARAGMGGGGDQIYTAVTQVGEITVETDVIRDHWGIPHSFLNGSLRMGGERARIIEVYGDSMYDPSNPNAPGSLFPGDRVIVDIHDINPAMPGPFLIWDGGLLVKLLERVLNSDPPRLRIMSRNPAYKADELPAEYVKVIGRVRARISVL